MAFACFYYNRAKVKTMGQFNSYSINCFCSFGVNNYFQISFLFLTSLIEIIENSFCKLFSLYFLIVFIQVSKEFITFWKQLLFVFHYLSDLIFSQGHRQNISGQLSGFWPLSFYPLLRSCALGNSTTSFDIFAHFENTLSVSGTWCLTCVDCLPHVSIDY